LQHSMWPCWFIILFTLGVPSARRFYFFIRSVRAFGTTQSLLDSPFIFRQRNIKFSFRRHILY
jgi:hypothetical protein